MAAKPYLTAPIATDKMPPAVPYIVGNEAAERFSYYGIGAILTIYLTQYITENGTTQVMTKDEARFWYHQWKAWAYFFPLVGSLLADIFWGKYRTILWLSIVYCLGHLALAINNERMGMLIGMALIVIGAGGIKPCVSSNVGDQFGKSNAHLMARVFGWFYFSINLGSALSTTLTPWLLQGTEFTLPGMDSPFLVLKPSAAWAFGVPGILMGVATLIFWLGRYKYVHIAPGGMKAVREALGGEGFPAIARVAVLFLFVAPFWSLFDQQGSSWVLQAEEMDLRITEGMSLKSSQTHTLNAILILLFIPLFSYVVYPLMDRIWPMSALRKISTGLFLAALSFVIPAIIESRLGPIQAANGGQLTFAPGETSKTVSAEVIGDTSPEGTETFSMRLSHAQHAAIANPAAICTIVDDDSKPDEPANDAKTKPNAKPADGETPMLSIGDIVANEGDDGATTATFTVTLSRPSEQAVNVNYHTVSGSAIPGIDYKGTPTISVFWQIPAYILLTAAEILVSITCLEFAYTQAPRRTKSFVMSVYLLSVFVGNQYASLVSWFNQQPDGTSRMEGATYYWFFVGTMLASATVFVLFAVNYKGKTYLQDEASAAGGDNST